MIEIKTVSPYIEKIAEDLGFKQIQNITNQNKETEEWSDQPPGLSYESLLQWFEEEYKIYISANLFFDCTLATIRPDDIKWKWDAVYLDNQKEPNQMQYFVCRKSNKQYTNKYSALDDAIIAAFNYILL